MFGKNKPKKITYTFILIVECWRIYLSFIFCNKQNNNLNFNKIKIKRTNKNLII